MSITGSRLFALDFDGVLNSYASWRGPTEIDSPVPGAQDFVEMLVRAEFTPVVTSTRAAEKDGLLAIQRWLRENAFRPMGVTHEKVPALCTLDDRVIRFDGLWPTMTMIEAAIRPWNR